MKRLTVTIGIPALNEEANIARLLRSLLAQKLNNTILFQIIVVDDGSTDNTAKEVLSLHSSKIKLVQHKKRKGISATQNSILRNTTTDFLAMLDADVIPKDEMCIAHLVAPLVLDKADLVGGSTVAVTGKGFVEKALAVSNEFKYAMYGKIHKGKNIYLCQGRIRAMNRAYYTKLSWIENVPEDAYSYLFAIVNGFRFAYAKKAVVLFRCPTTVAEHAKQRIRFLDSKNVLAKAFDEKLLNKEYAISKLLLIKTFVYYLLTHPVSMAGFLLINAYTKLFLSRNAIDHSKHQVAQSSKEFTL